MEKRTPSHLRQGQVPHCTSVMPTFSGEAEGTELGSAWPTWRVLNVSGCISKAKERRTELRRSEQRRREDRRGEQRGGEGKWREGSMGDGEKNGKEEGLERKSRGEERRGATQTTWSSILLSWTGLFVLVLRCISSRSSNPGKFPWPRQKNKLPPSPFDCFWKGLWLPVTGKNLLGTWWLLASQHDSSMKWRVH